MSEEYTRANPFLATIKQRYSLCKPGTAKQTTHIVVDISDSGMTYSVGDSLAVIPSNDPVIVQTIIKCLGANDETLYLDSKTNTKIKLYDYLLKHVNLADCTRPFIEELYKKQNAVEKKAYLEQILYAESSQIFKEYQKTNDVLSVLEANREVSFSASEFCSFLKPMMPRFYSIASSQKAVGDEVHLTVALQKWNIDNRECFGVCTHFLCDLVPMNLAVLPVYIHSHRGFTLPNDPQAPIIMVGPGTGVAPFRGFMQEREALDASGKNWLFFGEWNKHHHYFYEDYWSSLEQKGKVRLDLAFSRDQKEKVYVQHRMLEKGKELFKWLQDGAYLYVCGDASRMAKDVDQTLHQLVEVHGCFSKDLAKEFVKTLRQEKRYLRDVY